MDIRLIGAQSCGTEASSLNVWGWISSQLGNQSGLGIVARAFVAAKSARFASRVSTHRQMNFLRTCNEYLATFRDRDRASELNPGKA
jgi:hypothetical protein